MLGRYGRLLWAGSFPTQFGERTLIEAWRDRIMCAGLAVMYVIVKARNLVGA